MRKNIHDRWEWWPFAGLLIGLSAGILINPHYGWGLGALAGLVCGYILTGLHRSKKH